MFIISRAVNGITLNEDREYLTDNDGKIMEFETMFDAKKFLSEYGYTEFVMLLEGVKFEEVSKDD